MAHSLLRPSFSRQFPDRYPDAWRFEGDIFGMPRVSGRVCSGYRRGVMWIAPAGTSRGFRPQPDVRMAIAVQSAELPRIGPEAQRSRGGWRSRITFRVIDQQAFRFSSIPDSEPSASALNGNRAIGSVDTGCKQRHRTRSQKAAGYFILWRSQWL
jgi:hypothetical protein